MHSFVSKSVNVVTGATVLVVKSLVWSLAKKRLAKSSHYQSNIIAQMKSERFYCHPKKTAFVLPALQAILKKLLVFSSNVGMCFMLTVSNRSLFQSGRHLM